MAALATNLDQLLKQYEQAETQIRTQQLQQVDRARTYLQKIVDIYSPGGAYGAGMEAVLAGQKVQDVSKASQKGISSGLYGIRNYGAEWEATVGTPARLRLEDIKLERQTGALGALAQFEAGVNYEAPDYSNLMSAMLAGSSGETMTTSAGGYSSGIPGSRASQMWEEGLGTQSWETPGSRTGVGVTPGTATQGYNASYSQMMQEQGLKGTTEMTTGGTTTQTETAMSDREKYDQLAQKYKADIEAVREQYPEYAARNQSLMPSFTQWIRRGRPEFKLQKIA